MNRTQKKTKKTYKYILELVSYCKWCEGSGIDVIFGGHCNMCKGQGGRYKKVKVLDKVVEIG